MLLEASLEGKTKTLRDISPTDPSTEELVRKWGSSASIALLDPECKTFSIPDLEGIIGYKEGSKCVVVFGDPVCNPKDSPALALAFDKFCKAKGWHTIYITTSKEFATWAMSNIAKAMVQIEEELVTDPYFNYLDGSKGRILRKKMNHSEKCGVEIKEYAGGDPALEEAIEKVGVEWLKARKGPQIYMSHIHLFKNKTGKRWFYAKVDGKIVGILLLNELESKKGYVVNMLMVTPLAPNGTSERLAITAFTKLHEEGCHYVCFGSTAVGVGEIQGLGKISSFLARSGFNLFKKMFKLDQRWVYWQKYQPKSEKVFMLFSNPHVGLREVYTFAKALNTISNS